MHMHKIKKDPHSNNLPEVILNSRSMVKQNHVLLLGLLKGALVDYQKLFFLILNAPSIQISKLSADG